MAVATDAVERIAARGAGDAPTPEELLLRRTLDSDLRDAIESLSDVFRQAVWLCCVEDFTYAEIAQMLGVAPGTVMPRVSRRQPRSTPTERRRRRALRPGRGCCRGAAA